jgi:toxin-antitoxin system PIN domain toxin
LSYSVDVNVLIYASDSRSGHQAKARELLASCAASDDVFCLAWITVLAFLRISTNPRAFSNPLTPDEAYSDIGRLLAFPRVRLVHEEDGFWDAYRRVCRGFVVRGDDVPDAHLATLLYQNGVRTLYTNDAGFRRFEFLDVKNPFLDER